MEARAFGERKVTVYEERRVMASATSSLTLGYATNPIEEADPVGTLYLFGMGVCFASSTRLFSTNRRVLPTDIGYDYYRSLAHGGIKNVSRVLYKEAVGSVVHACDSQELQQAYDASVVDRLAEEEYADDDWEREYDLNCWRERELKRCSVDWECAKEEEMAVEEIVRRVVVDQQEAFAGRQGEKGQERESPGEGEKEEEKEEKEEGKKEERMVVYNIRNNIRNINSINVSKNKGQRRVFINEAAAQGMASVEEIHIAAGTPWNMLLVVDVVLLVAAGFSIFNILI